MMNISDGSMLVARGLVGVAIVTTMGCTPVVKPEAAPQEIRVEGTAIFFERLLIPPSAVVRVELRDTSRADAPARTLASQTIPPREGPPYKFSLSAPRGQIDSRSGLSVFAEIRDGDRLMFVTDTRHPVPLDGTTGLEVRLKFVSSAAGDKAPGIVTPAPNAYLCGKETFQIAFEEGLAYVTMSDGSLMTLDRLRNAGDPEQPRTFTNGKLTFVQEIEGQNPRVLFARGRMTPLPCSRAPAAP